MERIVKIICTEESTKNTYDKAGVAIAFLNDGHIKELRVCELPLIYRNDIPRIKKKYICKIEEFIQEGNLQYMLLKLTNKLDDTKSIQYFIYRGDWTYASELEEL